MSPELEQALYDRYPPIFVGRHAPPCESGMGWGCRVDDGWFALLDELCSKLQRETDQRGAPQVVALQVKEKFGSLRFRVREASLRQRVWIRLAERASMHTCEVCGLPGSSIHGSEGGVRARCDQHRSRLSSVSHAGVVRLPIKFQPSATDVSSDVALFLDDERLPPNDGRAWVTMRSVAEAQAWIQAHGCPCYVSFDNDLGEDAPEGWRLAQWLIDQDLQRSGFIPKGFAFAVHSQNCVRSLDITARLTRYLAYRDQRRV